MPTGGFIPSPEPIALPAPIWQLQGLLLGILLFNLVPMNLTTGGLVFLSWGEMSGRISDHLRQWVTGYLPITTSFTITTCIASSFSCRSPTVSFSSQELRGCMRTSVSLDRVSGSAKILSRNRTMVGLKLLQVFNAFPNYFA